MKLFDIFKKKNDVTKKLDKKTNETSSSSDNVKKSEFKLISYGYPRSKEKSFDTFYMSSNKQCFHLDSKNCRLVLQIALRTEIFKFCDDDYCSDKPYFEETYGSYINYYITKNSRYIKQIAWVNGSGEKCNTITVSREAVLNDYANYKTNPTSFSYQTHISKTVNKVEKLEVFDEAVFKDVIKEW